MGHFKDNWRVSPTASANSVRSGGLQISGLLIRTGVPIPPAAGPLRTAFLEHEGIVSLRKSCGEYGEALRITGLSLLPDMRFLPRTGGMWKTFVSSDDAAEPRARQRSWRDGRRASREWREMCSDILGISFAESKAAAESSARSALDNAVAAFNCLEDHPLGELAHQHAHLVAELVGGMFGCRIRMDDGVYWDECPLSLMHQRWGFSIGFTSTRICSICRADIDVCPHLIGHLYPVIIEKDREGRCNGCGRTDCTHAPGRTLDVTPVAIHDSVDLHEVSMTPRPRDPLARVKGIALDTDMLTAALGRRPCGEVLSCYRCLNPCSGFVVPPDRYSASEVSSSSVNEQGSSLAEIID
jgi:hypothetical protein